MEETTKELENIVEEEQELDIVDTNVEGPVQEDYYDEYDDDSIDTNVSLGEALVVAGLGIVTVYGVKKLLPAGKRFCHSVKTRVQTALDQRAIKRIQKRGLLPETIDTVVDADAAASAPAPVPAEEPVEEPEKK